MCVHDGGTGTVGRLVGKPRARLTMSCVSLFKQAEEKPAEKDAFDLKLVSFDDKSKIKVSQDRIDWGLCMCVCCLPVGRSVRLCAHACPAGPTHIHTPTQVIKEVRTISGLGLKEVRTCACMHACVLVYV